MRCSGVIAPPVANAWTQPGDLGVSSHDFLEGACVNCLYLPDGEQKNEDQIIAESFGVPDRLMQVRTLLYKNEGAPRDLLVAIATARFLPLAKLLPLRAARCGPVYRRLLRRRRDPLGELEGRRMTSMFPWPTSRRWLAYYWPPPVYAWG